MNELFKTVCPINSIELRIICPVVCQLYKQSKQYEVVAPRFESAYDAQLPEDKLKSTDREQFKECNAQLKEAVENDPELREKFDEE